MMKPGARRLVWLGGIAGAGVIAFALGGWRADGTVAPQEASASTPGPSTVSVGPADTAPAAALPGASMPATATAAIPASAGWPLPPADVSRRQRDIQIALSSDQRGKAGEAAKHIQDCLMAERNAEQRRQQMAARQQQLPEPLARAFRAQHDELLASCQAVDAASRAQLVPLLRRSLAEGDKGAAAGLVQALGKDFKLADEPGVVPALRRDAWDCDRLSQSTLSGLARRDPQLLTPDEVGALRDLQRLWISRGLEAVRRQAEGDPKRQAAIDGMLATLKPPPEANLAEVARISADIQSRCPVKPAGAEVRGR